MRPRIVTELVPSIPHSATTSGNISPISIPDISPLVFLPPNLLSPSDQFPRSPSPLTPLSEEISAHISPVLDSQPHTPPPSPPSPSSRWTISPFQRAVMPLNLAKIDQARPNDLPSLTEGKIVPLVLRKFEEALEDYFMLKKVAEDDRVGVALCCIKDPVLRTWIAGNRTDILSWSWEDFVFRFRMKALDRGWEDKLKTELCGIHQGKLSFDEFQNSLRALNSLLAGTRQFMSDDELRTQLAAHLHPDLAERCSYQQLGLITEFDDWVHQVDMADRELRMERERINRLIQETQKLNFRSSSAHSSGTHRVAAVDNDSSRAREPRVPKLTQDERALLHEHNGCTYCRKFYAGHRRCQNWPDARTYKTLTWEMAQQARKLNRSGKNVAAVSVDPVPEASTSGSTADEEVVYYDVDGIVAAVAAAPASNKASSYVCEFLSAAIPTPACPIPLTEEPPLAPLATPQLTWDCHLFCPDSNSSHPCNGALIDDGSSVVLIKESFADALGLKRRRLRRPVPLGSAFSGVSSDILLHDFVAIVPHNSDYTFRSAVTLQAIVSPSLCTDVILGGPFIRANRLLVDLDKNSCIARLDNSLSVDLTSSSRKIPSQPISSRRFVPLSEKRKSFNSKRRMFQSKEFSDRLQACYVASQGGSELPEKDQAYVMSAVKDRIDSLAFQEKLRTLDAQEKERYKDMFPSDIPPVHRLPDNIYHHFVLKEPTRAVKGKVYSCPRKYMEFWKTLVNQHLEAGRIRPSSSPFASPAFLIPKADPTALPRWVNDYRELNENTVPDNYPLTRVDTILSDAGKGVIWAKIDMTNAFFQTKVHPDDIKYTAVRTPIGLYEWVVMPMGCRNAPATHQRRMTEALRHLIGSICHVYLDDIIIWSSSVEEHVLNVRKVMDALREASLYCSLKKTDLFCTELLFLGHKISQAGIQADPAKVERISDWPVPKTCGDVRKFLGLVRYVSVFLPRLVDMASVLSPFTSGLSDEAVAWKAEHQRAFEGIKKLVVSHECLTVIDHENPGANKIFLTTDASDLGTGAVLSFGKTWESARPVAFDSKGYSPAEKNYPTHDKEMLAIIQALKKFRCELLGSDFEIFTDHRTLEYFTRQKELSKRQLRWQELMADYAFKITYVRGADNCVADALSRTIDDAAPVLPIAAVRLLSCPVPSASSRLHIALDDDLVQQIKDGYATDSWCRSLMDSGSKTQGVRLSNGLLYVNNRLAVPKVVPVREAIFRLAHDSLGHFGVAKTYAALKDSFYWPNMYSTLAKSYIPACPECQRNKSTNTLPPGPLHPIAPPNSRFDSVAVDFVGPLPEDSGFNYLITMTDRLGADIRLIPCRSNLKARDFASLFFDHWYCENGLPLDIFSDRDKLFLSDFWKELTTLLGVSLKMSTSFHPQTDGASERTNRTVIESLRYFVDRQQTGWVAALPRVRFSIMNTVNASSGFSGFQLRLGTSPRLVPPFSLEGEASDAAELVRDVCDIVDGAKDALVAAKALQAQAANKNRGPEGTLDQGDLVYLSTANRRREYAPPGSDRVAKFMPRFDGPWKVIEAWPETSNYRLDIPQAKFLTTFHRSQLRHAVLNDDALFPGRALQRPEAVLVNEELEWLVDRILDEKKSCGKTFYLVAWQGFGPEDNLWLPAEELEDCAALDRWMECRKPGTGGSMKTTKNTRKNSKKSRTTRRS
ncbi:hypothetical protein ONZ45_g2797 [Pleurotus djamor]|nr:hypothetical protein ONZ45_g2797 [Pleurotus djamor]